MTDTAQPPNEPPPLTQQNERIFISIASYRDAQLVPTVEDLVAKADEPALLSFGICWQHGEEQTSLPFGGDPQVKITDVPWRESRGACWARSKAMQLWSGEQWFLQVDSHCRFIQGWDTKLIRMMAQTGSPKPILSTYPNPFTPATPDRPANEVLAGHPQLIAVGSFNADGIPNLRPRELPDPSARTRPMAARFLAGGFLFAPGSFVTEVPYDPGLYFLGEEISITLRAFTSGYDLFHPVENVAWHDYVRSYAIRHWDDHDLAHTTKPAADLEPSASASSWAELDQHSRNKVAALLDGQSPQDATNPFGLGSVRTLADYEAYAGLSFRLRKMQDFTRRSFEPPNPSLPADWPDSIYTWLVRVTLDPAALSPCAFDPSGIWSVAIEDDAGNEIDRHELGRNELASLTGDEPQIVLVREIQSGIVPERWTVQPFSRERGWGAKLQGHLAESDFSIILDDPA